MSPEVWKPIAALAGLFVLNLIGQTAINAFLVRRVIRRELRRRRREREKYLSADEAREMETAARTAAGKRPPAASCPSCGSFTSAIRHANCSHSWHSEVESLREVDRG